MVTSTRRIPLSEFRDSRKLSQNPDLDRENKLTNSIHVPNCFIPVGIFNFNSDLPYLRRTDPRCPLKDCNIIQPSCGKCRKRGKYIF